MLILVLKRTYVVCIAQVWMKTRKGRKHMAKRWMDHLRTHYPPLYDTAARLNKEDRFEWVFTNKKAKKKKSSSSGRPVLPHFSNRVSVVSFQRPILFPVEA